MAFDAGVVDEDVTSAELLPGLLDEVLDVGGDGDVGLDGDGLASCGFNVRLDLVGCVGVGAVVHNYGRSFAGQALDDGLTDARGGPGDDCYLAFKALCHSR